MIATPSRTLAALRELIRALDRRDPHAERVTEMRIATESRLLRHQAAARIEALQHAGFDGERYDRELVDAIMTDDGGPPSAGERGGIH